MSDLATKIAESLGRHYDALVCQEIDRLMPLPPDIATIEALHDLTTVRKAKYLAEGVFSIEHCDCEIEDEYDVLLYQIAEKAFDIEKAQGGMFRTFEPVVSIAENPHKYGRRYKLFISEGE